MNQALLTEPDTDLKQKLPDPFGPGSAPINAPSSDSFRLLELARSRFESLQGHGAIVMKLGGSFMESPDLSDPKQESLWKRIAEEVIFTMENSGNPVVIVHGGGRAIETELTVRNIPLLDKIDGKRPTCDMTAEVVEYVLSDVINPLLVGMINKIAGYEAATGIRGSSLFQASKHPPVKGIDIGFVGEINNVDVDAVFSRAYDSKGKGRIVVVSPTASLFHPEEGLTKTVLNCNADTAAVMLGKFLNSDDRIGVQSFILRVTFQDCLKM